MTKPRKHLDEVVVLLRDTVYSRSRTGCCLHVAVDDGNMEAQDVLWCRDYAEQQGCAECVTAADALLALTEEERDEIYERYDDYA